MEKKNITLRIGTELHGALRILGIATKSTMNSMVTQAIEAYVSVRSQAVERDLEATLEQLRAARKRDPDHFDAIGRFAVAEGEQEDPIDGRATTVLPEAQTKMRRLLRSS
jgi:predicted transcriptional regulator